MSQLLDNDFCRPRNLIMSVSTALTAILVILAPAGSAGADSPNADTSATDSLLIESPVSLSYVKVVGRDLSYVLTTPTRLGNHNWLLPAAGVATVGVGMAFFDEEVRDFVQRNRSELSDDIANRFDRFGMNYPSWIMGAFAVVGWSFDDNRAKLVALDGVAANLIAGNIVSPLIKRIVGRYRPIDGQGPHQFDFWSDYDSFPSGHVVRVFANAAVITGHYRQSWVRITALAIATLVAFSRINHDAHWFSDTAGGALIGFAIGRGIVKLNGQVRRNKTHRLYH